MSSYVLKLDDSILSYIERYYYDYTVKRDNVLFLLKENANNKEFLSSEIFKYYEEQEREAYKNYDLARQEFYNKAIPEHFKQHNINWTVDFLKKEVTINMLCDCEDEEYES